MSKLSIVLITFNSEKFLEKVLNSCLFADEIVVVDSGSRDNTISIAQKYTNKIYHQKWLGYGPQKQFAVNQAEHDWVFVLDSDEIITEQLKQEILKILKKPKYVAYSVPRLNFFFGRPIKTCGLYPDRTVRLFDKKFGSFSQDKVHEKVIIKGKIGKLKNHILHYAYSTIEEFIEKQNKYSSLSPKKSRLKALISPKWTFFKLFFLKRGFLDGWHGYIIAKLYSQYTFWKYIKD